MAAGRQQGFVLDRVCLIPDTLLLFQAPGKLVDLFNAAFVIDGVIDDIPQGGDEAVCAAKGTLRHRHNAHLLHHVGDRSRDSGKGQGDRRTLAGAVFLEGAVGHLQHHRAASLGEVCRNFTCLVYLFEVFSRLYIALSGKGAALRQTMSLPEYCQQQVLKICPPANVIQHSGQFPGKAPAFIQERPKLGIRRDLGSQEADIGIEGQVDEAGEGDGSILVRLLRPEQAVQPHPVVLAQRGQPDSQEVQFQKVHIVTDHARGDAGITDLGQFIFTLLTVLDPCLLERVVILCQGTRHGQHGGRLISFGAVAADLHLKYDLIQRCIPPISGACFSKAGPNRSCPVWMLQSSKFHRET